MALKAYVYRLADAEVPEIGIAVASSVNGLFWILDEWTDPFNYEFTTAKDGDAVSNSYKDAEDEGEPVLGYIETSDERPIGGYLSEEISQTDDRKWKRFERDDGEGYNAIRVKAVPVK